MRRTWAAIALAGAVMAATGAEADIIKKEDMLRGITITRPQCAAIEQAVWVNASGPTLPMPGTSTPTISCGWRTASPR
jgi:hypothetical protein